MRPCLSFSRYSHARHSRNECTRPREGQVRARRLPAKMRETIDDSPGENEICTAKSATVRVAALSSVASCECGNSARFVFRAQRAQASTRVNSTLRYDRPVWLHGDETYRRIGHFTRLSLGSGFDDGFVSYCQAVGHDCIDYSFPRDEQHLVYAPALVICAKNTRAHRETVESR